MCHAEAFQALHHRDVKIRVGTERPLRFGGGSPRTFAGLEIPHKLYAVTTKFIRDGTEKSTAQAMWSASDQMGLTKTRIDAG